MGPLAAPVVDGAIRTEEVLPPSARAETSAVARAAFHIVYWAGIVIALEQGHPHRTGAAPATSDEEAAATAAATAATLAATEVPFRDLDPSLQRLCRRLQEGVGEAERVRAERGAWPTVEALASDGIPPFAPDPLDRKRYTFRLLREGSVVNYLGVPAPGVEGPALLAIVLEPEPGLPADTRTPPDETHHRLPDGMLLHVTLSIGPPPRDLARPLAAARPEAGFRRVALASPEENR